jgi:hypothetical protein
MPNRLSISIFLSFIAVLIAFYSGFVFSQTAPGASGRPLRTGHAALFVSVNVVSTCNFQVSPTAVPLLEKAATQNFGFGARCSLSQPLIVSGSPAGGVATGSTSQANLQVSPGSNHLNAQTGTPFWAETTDRGLEVTF